jgi:hemolysin III
MFLWHEHAHRPASAPLFTVAEAWRLAVNCVGVWLSAVIGMALKLALPGRFDRLAVVLCLLLGWSGVIAYDSLASALPSASLWLLAIGGILYSIGALFHIWQGLRFHNAIWHGFVLLAASCHYSAVLACLPWV